MTDLLTAAGLILTVLLAYMQIQRNQRAAIELQEAHLRNELKLKLYEKAAGIFHAASDRIRRLESVIRSVMWELQAVASGLGMPQTTTHDDILKTRSEATEGVASVLIALEQYEIVFSRFASFRRQLSESHSRLLDVFNNWWTKVVEFVPFQAKLGPLTKVSAESVGELETLQKALNDVCGDIGGYLIDLQIEAQNELLGDLFGRQLPPRAPGDPTIKVLTREATHLSKRTPGRLV